MKNLCSTDCRHSAALPKEKITVLDRRYTAVIQALDDLVKAVGLKAA
jgi:hypothetical protein